MTIAPARRCEFCGYDLRGITSIECPECGQAKTISLRFDDREHYHRARAALEHADLLVSFVNAGLAGEIVYASAKSAGWLRVSSTDYDRVADVLNDIGVRWIEEHRVFVDRIEPVCPRCHADLTGVSADVCIECGVGLQWMEAPDPLEADEEVVCPRCFRDVKLVEGRCPECGDSGAVDGGETDSASESTPAVRPPMERLAVWIGVSVLIALPLMLVVLTLSSLIGLHFGLTECGVSIVIAAIAAFVVLARRASKSRS